MPTIYVPGPLIETFAYRHALWTLSILEYITPDLQLILHGSDDSTGSIHRWKQGIITNPPSVLLVPANESADKLLAQADIIWLPQQHDGVPQHMESISTQQKPIFASNFPALVQHLKSHAHVQFLPADMPSLWAKSMYELLRHASQRRSAA